MSLLNKDTQTFINASCSILYFANDHGGVALKQTLVRWATREGIQCVNLGIDEGAAVDYPDLAHTLAQKLYDDENAFGVLICRTGIGMSMAANRYDHIRAAVCAGGLAAKHTRQDNNANVLCLGADTTSAADALEALKIFLEAPFLGNEAGGERHERRVNKISLNHNVIEGRRAGKDYV